MKVAILHYHLNQGGVTRVIAHHLRALSLALADARQSLDVLLIHGPGQAGWDPHLEAELAHLSIRRRECSLLGYDSDRPTVVDARNIHEHEERLHDVMSAILRDEGFAPDQTVLHIHNHSLGKNVALPGALARWADDGFAVLNQIHDFAEDFRPTNYARLDQAGLTGPRAQTMLYPQGPRVQYAVLNGRDRDLLTHAGVAADRLHWLPNPVSMPKEWPNQASARRELRRRVGIDLDKRYLLYPVRAIRRKNVGEALLWAALAESACPDGQGGAVGISLPATSPTETPFYERWRGVGQQLGVPIWFDVGQATGMTFPVNVAAADALLTTSLAEGFGMVFLEAWLAKRPLVGRDLPDITADFVDVGLRFPHLSSTLKVPIALIGRDAFLDAWQKTYTRVRQTFALPPIDPNELHAQAQQKIVDGAIDFGDLDETRQEIILEKALHDGPTRHRILDLNPLVASVWAGGDNLADPDRIHSNAQLIETHFNLPSFGQRLHQVYHQLLASPAQALVPLENSDGLLERLLAPERFRLLRA